MDKELRRCSICDYFEGGDEGDRRKFIFDTPTQEHHCHPCMNSIRELVGYNYWLNTEYRVQGTEASRMANRPHYRFGGYLGSEDPPLTAVAPTSSDLDAIQQWEELLQEMDLGKIEEVE